MKNVKVKLDNFVYAYILSVIDIFIAYESTFTDNPCPIDLDVLRSNVIASYEARIDDIYLFTHDDFESIITLLDVFKSVLQPIIINNLPFYKVSNGIYSVTLSEL